jgi:hypothetical protein
MTMQTSTYCPARIINTDNGNVWRLGRDGNGVRKYYLVGNPAKRGRLPSEFFSAAGSLYSHYKEVQR